MVIHIVKPNETLADIAALYGVSIQRIITDNGLFGMPNIVVGQALLILLPEIVHTVKKNETLYSISRLYNTTVINLLQKNPTLILDPNLYPGDKLTITFKNEGNKNLYLYGYTYPYVNETILKKSLPFLTSCAVFSYTFNNNGSITEISDQTVIDNCYTYKTVPTATLSSIDDTGNFSSDLANKLLNDIFLQNTVIQNLIDIMQAKGYAQVDIDFEYVLASDNTSFVNFLKNITDEMHRYGFTVNVALPPKVSSNQKGRLYEGYDYAKIGEIVDTVLIMTYEWGYSAGPPMAVAPIDKIKPVLDYSVSQIPPNKIYMGIPNYGYNWQLPYENRANPAKSIGNEEAVRIAAENNAIIKYDQIAQTPYCEYTDKAGKQHIIWFEDIRSIEQKFNLIDSFNLKGAGYWNLMRPFSQNWSYTAYKYNVNKIIKW